MKKGRYAEVEVNKVLKGEHGLLLNEKDGVIFRLKEYRSGTNEYRHRTSEESEEKK